MAELSGLNQRPGWKYSIAATNMRHMWGIAGSHQPQWLDGLSRSHATMEDRIRGDQAMMGPRNLPSKGWQVNQGWMLAMNLDHDLDCWVRLLALHDLDDLARAEIDTIRFRIYRLPARLARHARRRWLRIERTGPWAHALTLAWQRVTDLPAVT